MNTKYKVYLVGGAVRDELMGVPSKDLDYIMLAPSFAAMRDELLAQGCKIFVEKPEFLTVRCKHPALGCIDVACARRDGIYKDGRHPDTTLITQVLEEDLARRDFTCNAIAKSLEHGRYLDPFHGQDAISEKMLRAVGNAADRLNEDKLRAFRALRFATTKGFIIDNELSLAIHSLTLLSAFDSVSTERIREELVKMFRSDSMFSFHLLREYSVLGTVVANRGIWFRPTTESV